MWLAECHSWMEIALSVVMSNKQNWSHSSWAVQALQPKVSFTIDTNVWGLDIDFTTTITKWLDLWNTNAIGSTAGLWYEIFLGGQWTLWQQNDWASNYRAWLFLNSLSRWHSYKVFKSISIWKVNSLNSFLLQYGINAFLSYCQFLKKIACIPP